MDKGHVLRRKQGKTFVLETVDKEQHKKDVKRRKLTSKSSSIFSNTSFRTSFVKEKSPEPSLNPGEKKKLLKKLKSSKGSPLIQNNSSNVYNFNLILQPG